MPVNIKWLFVGDCAFMTSVFLFYTIQLINSLLSGILLPHVLTSFHWPKRNWQGTSLLGNYSVLCQLLDCFLHWRWPPMVRPKRLFWNRTSKPRPNSPADSNEICYLNYILKYRVQDTLAAGKKILSFATHIHCYAKFFFF